MWLWMFNFLLPFIKKFTLICYWPENKNDSEHTIRVIYLKPENTLFSVRMFSFKYRDLKKCIYKISAYYHTLDVCDKYEYRRKNAY